MIRLATIGTNFITINSCIFKKFRKREAVCSKI